MAALIKSHNKKPNNNEPNNVYRQLQPEAEEDEYMCYHNSVYSAPRVVTNRPQ